MEMEDHHHHEHQHHHQYSLTDLIRSSPHFPNSIQQPHPTTAELFPGHHRNLPPPLTANTNNYHEMMMFGSDMMMMMPRVLHDFPPSTTTDSAVSPPPPPPPPPLAAEGLGDASTGRWPRQETLTLLEIRSRLDPKFKEANQKGPLWEEVSRIMCEEHGYQRSGKKCREKFENLYKYYKKTKEGKAGRQDGKHYRFFRQLEALYGENIIHNNNNNNNMSSSSAPTTIETNINVFGGNTNLLYVPNSQPNQETLMFHPRHQQHHNKHCDSTSLTNSTTGFDTSSSLPSDDGSDDEDSTEKRRRKRRSNWKVKIKDFVDSQMRKLVEKQEEWLEKLVKTMEQKERERVLREEEWRKQEAMRLERENKFWAKERAWIEARDVALMDALQKLTGSRDYHQMKAENVPHHDEDGSEILNSNVVVRGGADHCWPESDEITRFQHLRADMEARFPHTEALFEHSKVDIL